MMAMVLLAMVTEPTGLPRTPPAPRGLAERRDSRFTHGASHEALTLKGKHDAP